MLKPTTDNNCGSYEVPKNHLENLLSIANESLDELCLKNPDLLVLPNSLGMYQDDIEQTAIFQLNNNILTTNNLMGFVGRNHSTLTITSRFARHDKRDYFLHYMLQRVFAINLFKFDQTSHKESIWDFLLYLFPYYLKKAYLQGLYKAYRREERNDVYLKGAIDVKRHVKLNNPFAGTIAYSTREHSYDNNLTQLIRHTIEHIKQHPWASGILYTDCETRAIISKFCQITQNRYNRNAREKVLSANSKKISHPYFTEYKPLQKICMQILQGEKVTYGADPQKVYGLLFDGAWLWEEYLNCILKQIGLTHPKNKERKNGIQLFVNHRSYPRYPDFYKKGTFVLDAKYKRLSINNALDRNDIHQLISYLYNQKAMLGGFIYPESDENEEIEQTIGELIGYAATVKLWNIQIVQSAKSFKDFTKQMEMREKALINRLMNY